MRRGSEWWNEGVKMKVEEKKRAFEEWLQCNSVEKYERYREKNVEAKRKVEEAKRMSNFKWGQDFDRSYDGRSARGRPRFGWMDGVERALNDRRMDIREASERARNRNECDAVLIGICCCHGVAL